MRNLMVAALVAVSAASIAAQGKYNVPRTPDGHPDFQGYWTNLTYTPFERPKALAGRAFYTEKEAIDAFNKAVAESQNQAVHPPRRPRWPPAAGTWPPGASAPTAT